MFRGASLAFFTVILRQTFCITNVRIANGELLDQSVNSKMFLKYQNAYVSVIGSTRSGTGFFLDVEDAKKRRKNTNVVITAAHVVEYDDEVTLILYRNHNDSVGYECSATVKNSDISRDLAFLFIDCTECDCAHAGSLQARVLDVVGSEKIWAIGDHADRGQHTIVDGILVYPDTLLSLLNLSEKYRAIVEESESYIPSTHFLYINVGQGDSGSAVIDEFGHVIGMIVGRGDYYEYCLTIKEILKAYKETQDLYNEFFACTADESHLLGRKEVARNTSGKHGVYAIAAMRNASYVAFSFDENNKLSRAFTVYTLWWVIFDEHAPDFDDDEDECLEEKKHSWKIYEQKSTKSKKIIPYKPSRESLAVMMDIANHIQKKTDKNNFPKQEL